MLMRYIAHTSFSDKISYKQIRFCTEKKFFGLVFTPYSKMNDLSEYMPITYIGVRNTLKSCCNK
jgi:hypothetical protein